MKKRARLMIGIVITLAGILSMWGCGNNKENQETVSSVESEENIMYAMPPQVRVNGVSYQHEKVVSEKDLDLEPVCIGEITSECPLTELPTEDMQSNHGLLETKIYAFHEEIILYYNDEIHMYKAIPNAEEISEEIFVKKMNHYFASMSDMNDFFYQQWVDKLAKEGKLSKEQVLRSSPGEISKWFSCEKYFATPQKYQFVYFIEDEKGVPYLFVSMITGQWINDKIHVTECTDIDYSRFDGELINKYGGPRFFWRSCFDENGNQLNINDCPLDNYIECLAARWKEQGDLSVLQDPVTAFETLMHITEKGQGEYVSRNHLFGKLHYKTVEGIDLYCSMEHINEAFYPSSFFGGESFQTGKTNFERMKNNLEEMEVITAKQLREEAVKKDDISLSGVASGDSIVEIQKIEDKDVTLYWKTREDDSIILDGDRVIRVSIGAGGPQIVLPRLYVEDYDQDGDLEYAIVYCSATGTGNRGSDLLMIDIVDGEQKEFFFRWEDARTKLLRVSGEVSEDKESVLIYQDGVDTGVRVPLTQMEDIKDGFGGVRFGDFWDIEENNHQLYFIDRGGCKYLDSSRVERNPAIFARILITYHEDGSFTTGELNLDIK